MSLPFFGFTNATVNLSVTSSSGSVKVSGERGTVNVRLYNAGSMTMFVNAGDSNVAASTSTGIPIPPGLVEVQTFNNNGNGPLYIAAIAVGSAGTLYLTPGRGE